MGCYYINLSGFRVVGKPATWKWCLQHFLKDSSNREEEPGVVYRLICNDCDRTYIGEIERTASTRAKEHASYVRNGRFDMSAAADHALFHQHSLSFKTVQIVDHESCAARGRVKEALHIRTEKNPMNKDKGLEQDQIWFSVVWIFSYRDRFYANFPISEQSPNLLQFFHMRVFPPSCSLVTLDTLRLIHKTPTSTPNVTFPQLRQDNAPHLPDSSRKSISRFKMVGIFFFCCLLKMAGATRPKRRALQNWLLVWWEKDISNEYPARTHSVISSSCFISRCVWVPRERHPKNPSRNPNGSAKTRNICYNMTSTF